MWERLFVTAQNWLRTFQSYIRIFTKAFCVDIQTKGHPLQIATGEIKLNKLPSQSTFCTRKLISIILTRACLFYFHFYNPEIPVKTGKRDSALQNYPGKAMWEMEDEGKSILKHHVLGRWQLICPPLHLVLLLRGTPLAFLRMFCCSPLPWRTHLAQWTDLCLSQRDEREAAHNQSQC